MKPYYEHGGITIYHGDCREVLPSLVADVVVTDAPYGIGKAHWDEKIVPVNSWLPLCLPRPTAIFVGVQGIYDYPKPTWVASWVRRGSTQRNGALQGFNNWEPILLYGLRSLANDVISTPNYHEDFGHPTTKPLSLMRSLVLLMPPGVVLDPFMGSGTTLRAAKDLGRKAIGIELEERYCELAANRMRQEVFSFDG